MYFLLQKTDEEYRFVKVNRLMDTGDFRDTVLKK